MTPARSNIAPLSDAASSARRLSQRAAEALLVRVIAEVPHRAGDVGGLLASYDEPLMAFTANRRIIAANAAAEEVFGYQRGELDGHLTDEVIPARFRQPDAPPMQAVETLTTVELPGLRRDGSEPLLSWTFGASLTPDEPVFVMVIRDRGAIDDALEALHASEQRFRLLVEGVRDHAVIMLTSDGRIASWNTGAEQVYGWCGDEAVGLPYETFFSPEDRASGVPAEHLTAAVRDGSRRAAGWRVRKDGTRFFAESSLWPLHAHDGHVDGFAKVTHDLTAKREAEEAARNLAVERAARAAAEAGRDRLARLHRSAQALSRTTTPSAVVTVVLETCLIEVGAAGGGLMVLSDDESTLVLLGQRGHSPGPVTAYRQLAVDAETPAREVIKAQQAAFFESAEACLARYPGFADAILDGGFEATAVLPLIIPSRVIGLLLVRYRDRGTFAEDDRALLLTLAELCAQAIDRAHLFEAQAAARVAAEAASRAKDEFLAMLGHELRNPLAPIATAVELMKLRGDPGSRRERDVIERQVRHISRLVDDLLDVSRIARGKLELAQRPVDLAEVIERAVEMASPLFEQRHHQLTLEVPQGVIVDADPARLAQVVANLLTNAAKYTRPNGEVLVSVTSEPSEVVIRVRDNGDGIEPGLLPHVFELFTQGKRTFDRADGGLGIGLALVKNLVSLHGGVTTVTSTVGLGSEFTVRLPRARRADSIAAMVGAAPNAAPDARRRRVLVVDDNRDFAEVLASSLSELGYEVVTASDGLGAIDLLRRFTAEAAIVDLGLPVIDGFELARQIREEFAAQAPRLIAVTGYGQASDRERTARVGFAEHLVKPIDMSTIIAALERR